MPAKLTIQDAHNLAESRGFKFLSPNLNNVTTKHLWLCGKGHEWSATYHRIQQGSGCLHCANKFPKTIQNAYNLAESRGFKFLSSEFKKCHTKYSWGCEDGHEWKASYTSIQQGTGCPYCALKPRRTREDAHNFAEERGFKFLSTEFQGANNKYLWGCKKGHEWIANYRNIRDGSGCPVCNGNQKKTITDCQKLAESKGGKCLSIKYVNNSHKLLWECNKNHKWEATYGDINNKTWCPTCGSKKKSIQDCHKYAEAHNGKCLSTEFKNVSKKHTWQCDKGHTFSATPKNVSAGHWCPFCAKMARTLNIDNCHQLAKLKGGECLSTKYFNAHSKITWRCKKGHSFDSSYANVYSGKWCPKCITFRGETITRYCFEQIFKCDFEKIKPDWMRNAKTNRKLELDGFNDKLSLAFEHQGIHHETGCEKNNKHYDPEVFIRDEIKRQKCKEHGIKLIEVPEIGTRLKINDVVPFLLNEFDKHNIAYPESAKSFQIDMKEFYAEYMNQKSTTGVDDLLSELDAIDFSDDSLFVDSIMDEVNNLDFDDPELFN
jgi:hypothetical protein